MEVDKGWTMTDPTEPLRLRHDTSGDTDVSFFVDDEGSLTITPDGGTVTVAGRMNASVRFQASGYDIIDGQTTTLYMGGLTAHHNVLILRANNADYLEIDQPAGVMSVLNGMNLVVSGSLGVTGDVIASVIRRGTIDGADDDILTLAGGGAAGETRGAYIQLYGNESSGAGYLHLISGHDGDILLHTGAGSPERARITSGGVLCFGTTVAIDAAAGEIVIPYQHSLRGADFSSGHTHPLISLNQSGGSLTRAVIGGGYAGAAVLQIVALTAASLPPGSADVDGAVTIDKTNHRLIFYDGGNRYYSPGTAF